jgi:predicted O-methyltransferase YrrM
VFARFLKTTAVGRVLMIPYRLFLVAAPYVGRHVLTAVKWAFVSKEHYNHTYHLTPLNRQYLASFISVVSGHPVEVIEGYMAELENDSALRETLVRRTLSSPARHYSDAEPRYGRRLGWYALLRATKPRVVVETGIDRGLGTVVLAAALKRNSAEGFSGLVYATDIVPDCGHLIDDTHKQFCRILIGDSVDHLKQFTQPVDIFLHDSDHRAEYEWAEFLAIEPRLYRESLVLSDNSQQTSKLQEFAKRTERAFLFFQDIPQDHWWIGDGMGANFRPGQRYLYQ